MKKTILIAATLCFCSMNMKAQDTTKEEGFVFTTVKENRLPLSRIRTVRVPVGASQPSVSLNRNCSVWEKANTTSRKCSSFTIQ